MNKRGMSLVTLAVTLVILILITSTVVVSGLSAMESAKKTSFGIEIKNVQEIIDENISAGEEIPIIKTITLDTTALTDPIKTEQFLGETITANRILLNVIDLSKLGLKDIKYGRGETALDYYAISPVTNKVYYPAGVKAAGKVYYTLTADLNKAIGKNDLAATTKKSVIFKADKTTSVWVNSPVIVTVKVPEAYGVLENAVTVTNGVNVPVNPTIIDGYKQYIVNDTTNLTTNYTITVSYTDNGISKIAVYNVKKVDGVVPDIDELLIGQTHNIDNSTNIATAYITNINFTDSLSGIKSIKYIKGTIDASVDRKEFFNQYGIDVVDNKVQIEQGATSYSICAEDNAGNINVISVVITDYIQSILW